MLDELYIIDSGFEFFSTQYSEPHRKYHNYQHIQNMFAYAIFRKMELSEEQMAAICFHDIYYDTNRSAQYTNEFLSATYAYHYMRTNFGYDDARASIVKNIILDTENHLPDNAGDWSTPVLDLDLWHLYDSKEYKKVAWLIRQEYCNYSWKEFSAGRKEWLEKMLSRDIIYQSMYANSTMNELAFGNLSEELNNIKTQSKWIDYIIRRKI